MKDIASAEEFQQHVLDSELPVVVDFYTPYCPPCKLIAPILEQFASDQEGKINVVKVDASTQVDIALKYGVMAVPVLKLFQGGNVTAEHAGAISREQLDKWTGQNAQ